MNAPFVPPDPKAFEDMGRHVDAWRGECIQQFAELEQIVENLLQQLRENKKHGKRVVVGQLVGPAFSHLRELTGSRGPFAAKGKAISTTLARLAIWFDWRAHLTHGAVTLWRGRKDKWLLALAHRPTGDSVVRMFAITWDEARAMRKVLIEEVPTLRENARSLVNSVRTN